MTATEFATIAEALAWPAVAFVALVLFYPSVAKLIYGLATSLRIKSIKVMAFGIEAELSPQEVKATFDELLQEISDPTNELKSEELLLLDKIAASEGRRSVIELVPSFERGDNTLDQLRRLRDRHLIRPAEGSRWLPEKHPVLTRFGRLVLDLRERTRNGRGDA
ncbi:MAG: hypothetical protein ACK50G_03000 [bacterium]|jgi:hypothetical protein